MNFNSVLKVGKYKQHFCIGDHFPMIPNDQTIGVLVSGGIESTLLVLMCDEIYGKEKTILYYSDHLFAHSDFTKNIIRNNVYHIAKVLDRSPTYIPTSKEEHAQDAKQHVLKIKKFMVDSHNSHYGMLGFTKNFWELEKLLLEKMSPEEFTKEMETHPDQYSNLIEEYHFQSNDHINHIQNIDIHPDTYYMVRNPEIYGLLLPISKLNKHGAIDIYLQNNWEDILYQTRSCVDADNIHCGKCFACQQRHDAFDILGIDDPTIYQSDQVKQKRKKLIGT